MESFLIALGRKTRLSQAATHRHAKPYQLQHKAGKHQLPSFEGVEPAKLTDAKAYTTQMRAEAGDGSGDCIRLQDVLAANAETRRAEHEERPTKNRLHQHVHKADEQKMPLYSKFFLCASASLRDYSPSPALRTSRALRESSFPNLIRMDIGLS